MRGFARPGDGASARKALREEPPVVEEEETAPPAPAPAAPVPAAAVVDEPAPPPAPAPQPEEPAPSAALRRTLSQLFKEPVTVLTALGKDAELATQTITPPSDAVELVQQVMDIQRCSAAREKRAAVLARREAEKENESTVAQLRREVELLRGDIDAIQRRTFGLQSKCDNALARKDKVRDVDPLPPRPPRTPASPHRPLNTP